MPDLITEELLDALAQEESRGRMVGGDRHLTNKAYRTFQIRLPAYQDVVQRRPKYADIPFEQVQTNPETNRTFAQAYLDVLQRDYGMNTIDQLLAAYNAGPTAVRQQRIPDSTLRYIL